MCTAIQTSHPIPLFARAGADTEIADKWQLTPLHSALSAKQGGTECVSLLLAACAWPDARDADGFSPLHVAASLQHVSAAVVQLLLEAGADIHAAISAGNRLGQATAVQLAAAHGCAEQLVALIAAGADFQAPGAADCTALSFAACNRHEPCVRILLEQGAQVMAMEAGPCLWILHVNQHAYLAYSPGPRKANPSLLLLWQVNENETNSLGNSELHVAVAHRQPNIVRLLLEAGASTAVRNSVGDQPIHLAVVYGCAEAITLLAEFGADLEAETRSPDCRTPLQLAVGRGCEECTLALLAAGAELNNTGSLGVRPAAVARQHSKACASMLARAAARQRLEGRRQAKQAQQANSAMANTGAAAAAAAAVAAAAAADAAAAALVAAEGEQADRRTAAKAAKRKRQKERRQGRQQAGAEPATAASTDMRGEAEGGLAVAEPAHQGGSGPSSQPGSESDAAAGGLLVQPAAAAAADADSADPQPIRDGIPEGTNEQPVAPQAATHEQSAAAAAAVAVPVAAPTASASAGEAWQGGRGWEPVRSRRSSRAAVLPRTGSGAGVPQQRQRAQQGAQPSQHAPPHQAASQRTAQQVRQVRPPQPVQPAAQAPHAHTASCVPPAPQMSAAATAPLPAAPSATTPARPSSARLATAAGRLGLDARLITNLLCCPITQEPLADPVLAADGQTYERAAMEGG